MRKYHTQGSTHTCALDVRDEWRRQIASDGTLGAGALRVALILLNFANRSGFTSVGVQRIAAELGGKDRRNVERGLAQLRKGGHLEREAGGGVAGRGGSTSASRLVIHKDPATGAGTSRFKVPATGGERPGDWRPKDPAPVAGETLLTHITRAEHAPGLEAGSGPAKNGDTGSATAGPGGEVLALLGNLTTSTRAEPLAIRDAVLSGLRLKFGLRPKATVSGYENSPPADTGGGSDVRGYKAK